MTGGALDLPAEYVRLGLRFDRLEPGFVDAYTGDPRTRAQVLDEPAPTPQQLRDRARQLLRELDSADLPADRTEFLRGQLTGLECSARKLSGEPVGFVEEVSRYFQVDVALGDEADYAAAHAELDALLPGGGSLAERYAAHRRREECPPATLEAAVHALSSALRDRVRGQYGLPEVETVRYEVVTDKPWSGFNYYEGGYRSRVAINADSLGYVSEQGLIAATEQPANRLCTACFTGTYPIPLEQPEVLGKHVLESIGNRALTGWTGQQAGSATVPGGAEDALLRP